MAALIVPLGSHSGVDAAKVCNVGCTSGGGLAP